MKQGKHITHQTLNRDTLQWESVEQLFACIKAMEMAGGSVKPNFNLLPIPLVAYIVGCTAQGDSSVAAHETKPAATFQIGINTLQVKHILFPLDAERSPRMLRLGEGGQWRSVLERSTRQAGIEKIASLVQRIIESLPIAKGDSLDDLTIPQLVTTFGHSLVSGPAMATEVQCDAQSNQPHVQPCRKWRFRFVVIENTLMVHLQGLGQAPINEGQPQRRLIVTRIGMSFDTPVSQPTGITQQAQMRAAVIEIDQANATNIGNDLIPLRIHFPHFMWQANWLIFLWQLLVSFIALGQA